MGRGWFDTKHGEWRCKSRESVSRTYGEHGDAWAHVPGNYTRLSAHCVSIQGEDCEQETSAAAAGLPFYPPLKGVEDEFAMAAPKRSRERGMLNLIPQAKRSAMQ